MPAVSAALTIGAAALAGQALAGAPLKGVDVKLGKAERSCGPTPSPAATTVGATGEPAPDQCAPLPPTPTPTPEQQAGKATKTRSNIQNN